MATVQVRIEWPEDAPFPQDPCARVTVEDVTSLDAPSTVVAETVLDDVDPTQPGSGEVQIRSGLGAAPRIIAGRSAGRGLS